MKKENKTKKQIVIILSATILLFLCSFFVSPLLIDPSVQKFDQYHRLYNWDSKQHAMSDFDNDGIKDLITFTGCAFLSSTDEQLIPEEKRCTAEGITEMAFPGEKTKIGQSYTSNNNSDLSSFEKKRPIKHSYLAKNQDSPWKIYVHLKSDFKIYQINSEGFLEATPNVGLATKIDEFLYALSHSFLIPLVPINLLVKFLS